MAALNHSKDKNKVVEDEKNTEHSKSSEFDPSTVKYAIPIPLSKNPNRRFRAWKIPNTSLSMVGYSRSRDKTFFHIPEISVALDAGHCRGRLCDYVFLTHGHSDHSYDVSYMCTGQDNMTIYCPKEICSLITDSCRSFIGINRGQALANPQWRFKINGCQHDDVVCFKENTYRAIAFKCHHSVPCLGYKFEQKRRKRKKEYEHLTHEHRDEIIKLKKQGVQIEHEVWIPMFVYVGDTSINVFQTSYDILNYPVIIIECTFLYEDNKIEQKIKDDGHIIWKQLKPYILKNRNITWVLIHFSCRYDEDEIFKFFQLEEKKIILEDQQNGINNSIGLQNCVIWSCLQSDGDKKPQFS